MFKVDISFYLTARLPDNVRVPYVSISEYFRVITDLDWMVIQAGLTNKCPTPNWNGKVDMSEPGMVKTIRFNGEAITKFKVL